MNLNDTMYMCNYKSVFINKLSILKFGADPCRLGHVSFHKKPDAYS